LLDDVEGRFYWNQNFIKVFIETEFPCWNSFIEFFFLKILLLKPIFTTSLNWIIFKTSFFWIGLTIHSTIFNFISWRYLRLSTFENYTGENFMNKIIFFLPYLCTLNFMCYFYLCVVSILSCCMQGLHPCICFRFVFVESLWSYPTKIW